MSWSIACIGKPENVVAEIERVSAELTGQSKVEFDDAKPHLVALVKENFAPSEGGYVQPLIELNASGSGGATPTHQVYRSCQVRIEPRFVKLV